MFDFVESEGLIVPNTDNQLAGPRAYGYVSDLPDPDSTGPARLSDLWCWAESQETTMMSPAMFRDFFLPYIARVTSRFGLVYYGCCEPVHDRLEMIMAAMPNLRSVSVSPWADFEQVAGMLGRDYVFSRKPDPVPISGPTATLGARRGRPATHLRGHARRQRRAALPRRLRRRRRPHEARPLGGTGEVRLRHVRSGGVLTVMP